LVLVAAIVVIVLGAVLLAVPQERLPHPDQEEANPGDSMGARSGGWRVIWYYQDGVRRFWCESGIQPACV